MVHLERTIQAGEEPEEHKRNNFDEINNFFMINYQNIIGIFVKFI